MIYKNFIGGAWTECSTGKTFENIDPAHTDTVIAEFQDSSAIDIDRAVEHADQAFLSWKNTWTIQIRYQ